MGGFSKIFNSPQFQQAFENQPKFFARNNLRRAVKRTGRLREDLATTGGLAATSAGTADERARRRVGAAASSVAAQSETGRPTNFASALNSATRRAKVRQGIAQRGEPAIQNQALRDRLAVARRGATRRGRMMQGSASAANIREGVNLGVGDADALINASRADLAGGFLGGVTGVLADKDSRARLAGIGRSIGGLFGNSLSDTQLATATSNLFSG